MAIGLALTGFVAYYVSSSEPLLRLIFGNRLLFFGLMLLSSYSNYFSRKYKIFKLISPIPSTISFAVGIWILSTIYNELFNSFENFPDFTIISNFIINNIILIFIVVLILGYIINISILFKDQGKNEKPKNE